MFADDPDYIVEIGGQRIESPKPRENQNAQAKARPYISVLFECCNIYHRIYRNRAGTAYEGHCPKCTKLVKAKIGANGTAARFFRAK